MKKILLIPTLLALLGFSSMAHAGKLYFGTQESIHFLAPTKLQNLEGKTLNLGHRVAMKSFLLPYYVESKGYVLSSSSDSKRYASLPSEAEVEALQIRGMLPKPLPPLALGWFDYLLGYSLWIALFFIVGIPLLKSRFAKK